MPPGDPIIVPVDDRRRRFYAALFYAVCVLAGGYIFFSFFPYGTSLSNICFYSSVGLSLLLVYFRAIPVKVNTPLTIPFVLFFLWSSLGLVWALNFANTLNDLRGQLLYYLMLFFILINFFNTPKRLNWLIRVIVLSAVVFSVVSMVFYYVVMDNPVMVSRLGGVLPDGRHIWRELSVNMIGALTVPALLFCFYLYGRVDGFYLRLLWGASAGIIFAATILTQSRGTLAALIMAVIVFLLIKSKKLLPLFLVIIALVFLFSPFKNRMDTLNLSERIKINYLFMQVVRDHPLGGVGFGINTYFENIDIKGYIRKVPDHWKPLVPVIGPHAWLLDIMVRVGLIGFALFGFVIGVFLRMSWQVVRKARDPAVRDLGLYVLLAFLSYFIVGLAEPLFWESAPAMIFYILAAMMTILFQLDREFQRN